jgi:hypothetical protein
MGARQVGEGAGRVIFEKIVTGSVEGLARTVGKDKAFC